MVTWLFFVLSTEKESFEKWLPHSESILELIFRPQLVRSAVVVVVGAVIVLHYFGTLAILSPHFNSARI